MTTTRKRRAWVLQWGWAGDNAVEPYPWIAEQPIAAILSPRLGPTKVRMLTQHLHDAVMLDPVDMFDDLRQGHPTYSATPARGAVVEHGHSSSVPWLGQFICGHNPYLEAFLATVTRVLPAMGAPSVEVQRDPPLSPRVFD